MSGCVGLVGERCLEKWRVTANRYGVTSWNDEHVLKLILVMDVQFLVNIQKKH